MSKRYSGKSFKDSSVMKKPKLTLKEKRKLKKNRKKESKIQFNSNCSFYQIFVYFLGKQDGLVHISELADKRVAKVTDVVKEGDEVKVKVIGFDRGKVKLSIKQAAI